MSYLWLKAFHVTAVVVWIGGMLFAVVAIAAAARNKHPVGEQLEATLVVVRRWDRCVTSPAMILAWAAGLSLAMVGGWFPQGWLLAKVAVVLGLSAFHGLLSGRLQKIASGQSTRAFGLRYAPLCVMLAVTAIVVLVVVKPF